MPKSGGTLDFAESRLSDIDTAHEHLSKVAEAAGVKIALSADVSGKARASILDSRQDRALTIKWVP